MKATATLTTCMSWSKRLSEPIWATSLRTLTRHGGGGKGNGSAGAIAAPATFSDVVSAVLALHGVRLHALQPTPA